MSDTELQHRLAAIMAADAAGYSRLMAGDDRATVAALDAARAVFRRQIGSHQGRVIDMAGDSVLAVFGTATGAVAAALAIQVEVNLLADAVQEERRMRFRIGIHLGDVIEKADGTVYGDGVNIAARLEGLADPGGISVSDSIRTAVKGKVAASFDDQGEQTVKNIPDPVRAWRVRSVTGATTQDVAAPIVGTATKGTPAGSEKPPAAPGETVLALPDKPSIAVLPFANMSGDPEQEYFTDGITEDIITELSRFHELFVIARNSAFTYKGKALDVRTVARELGVRYVLEGSIRKAANRIRVTGQLVDALTGNHIWAEKYDRVLEDIFALQEELTRSIVVAIAPHIEAYERDKARRHRPENLSAYEIAVRAYAKVWDAYGKSDTALCNAAIAEARAALVLDPRSTLALNALAFAQWQHLLLGTASDRDTAWREGMDAASRSIDADRDGSLGYTCKGLLLSYASGEDRMDEALANLRRARDINPHNMSALIALGSVEIIAGNAAQAIEPLLQALRISPRDPRQFITYSQLAVGSFCLRQYRNGAEFALRGIQEMPGDALLHAQLAMNLVGLAEFAKAATALQTARQSSPGFIQRALDGELVLRNPDQLRRATTFLRIAAGLEDPSAADVLR